MQKWEYATVPLLVHATKQILDTWGEDGWELVQVVPGPEPGAAGRLPEAAEAHERGAVEERLAELGLTLPRGRRRRWPPTCRPSGPGAYVYTSGQLPMVGRQAAATGKVGAEVTRRGGQGAGPDVRAERAGRGRRRGRRPGPGSRGWSRSSASWPARPDFTGQPGVVNGASELLGEVFGEAGRHARSAVGVAVLPLDAPVEVELIVEVDG